MSHGQNDSRTKMEGERKKQKAEDRLALVIKALVNTTRLRLLSLAPYDTTRFESDNEVGTPVC